MPNSPLQIRRCLASERRMQQFQFSCWHTGWCLDFGLSDACLIFTSNYSLKCNDCNVHMSMLVLFPYYDIIHPSHIHHLFTPKTDPNVSQIQQSNGLFVSNEGLRCILVWSQLMYNSAVLFQTFKRFQIPEAGGSCDVLCKYPYVGTPGEALTEDVRWKWYWMWCMRVFYVLPWYITNLWSTPNTVVPHHF